MERGERSTSEGESLLSERGDDREREKILCRRLEIDRRYSRGSRHRRCRNVAERRLAPDTKQILRSSHSRVLRKEDLQSGRREAVSALHGARKRRFKSSIDIDAGFFLIFFFFFSFFFFSSSSSSSSSFFFFFSSFFFFFFSFFFFFFFFSFFSFFFLLRKTPRPPRRLGRRALLGLPRRARARARFDKGRAREPGGIHRMDPMAVSAAEGDS